MLFTAAERRLLALLAVLLGIGYANAALCHLALLPADWCRGCRGDRSLEPAPGPTAALGLGAVCPPAATA